LIEQAVHVSRKRVVPVMQEEGLKARMRKRFKTPTMSDYDQPVAVNLLDRRFKADTRRLEPVVRILRKEGRARWPVSAAARTMPITSTSSGL